MPSLCNTTKAGDFNSRRQSATTVRVWGIGVLLFYLLLSITNFAIEIRLGPIFKSWGPFLKAHHHLEMPTATARTTPHQSSLTLYISRKVYIHFSPPFLLFSLYKEICDGKSRWT